MGIPTNSIFLLIFCILFIQSYASLTSTSVKEKSCPDLSIVQLYTYTNPAFMVNPTTYFYLPMASQFTYRHFAEAFLGRSAENQAELDAMKYHGYLVNGIIGNTGFGTKYFHQTCQPTNLFGLYPANIYQQHCVQSEPSGPGTDKSRAATAIYNVVWSDNLSVLMVTRCVNGDAYDWGVWSSSPTLSPDVIKEILVKVDHLGFDSAKVQYAKY